MTRPTKHVDRPSCSPITNNNVALQWAAGCSARNHARTFHTDGMKLYSYNLMIGDTCPDTGAKVLKGYTAKGTYGFSSMTTSKHVGIASRLSSVVVV